MMKLPAPTYRNLRRAIETEMMQHRAYHYPKLPNHKALTLTAYRINALIMRTLIEHPNQPVITQSHYAATLITCIPVDYATKILTGKASMEEHGKLNDYILNKNPHLYALIYALTYWYDRVHAISRTQTTSTPIQLATINEHIVRTMTVTMLTHPNMPTSEISRLITYQLTGYHIPEEENQ